MNVCQRPIVNEVLGPLVTEFVRNFGREGATSYQRGMPKSVANVTTVLRKLQTGGKFLCRRRDVHVEQNMVVEIRYQLFFITLTDVITKTKITKDSGLRPSRVNGIFKVHQERCQLPTVPPGKESPMPAEISEGDTGRTVSEAQYLLGRSIQEPPVIDGVFDATTKTAVEHYQQMFGLPVTGVVGNETWSSLLSVIPIPPKLKVGSEGPVVRRVQRALNELTPGPPFHFLVEDGMFGPKTEAVVKEFQTSRGLVADGVIDLTTWGAAMGLANVRFATIVGL